MRHARGWVPARVDGAIARDELPPRSRRRACNLKSRNAAGGCTVAFGASPFTVTPRIALSRPPIVQDVGGEDAAR
jgi:hypothetical protein